jgi:hypothetical protein
MTDIAPETSGDGVGAASEANGRVTGGTQADEDTKFQKAISVWRSGCAPQIHLISIESDIAT